MYPVAAPSSIYKQHKVSRTSVQEEQAANTAPQVPFENLLDFKIESFGVFFPPSAASHAVKEIRNILPMPVAHGDGNYQL